MKSLLTRFPGTGSLGYVCVSGKFLHSLNHQNSTTQVCEFCETQFFSRNQNACQLGNRCILIHQSARKRINSRVTFYILRLVPQQNGMASLLQRKPAQIKDHVFWDPMFKSLFQLLYNKCLSKPHKNKIAIFRNFFNPLSYVQALR